MRPEKTTLKIDRIMGSAPKERAMFEDIIRRHNGRITSDPMELYDLIAEFDSDRQADEAFEETRAMDSLLTLTYGRK